MNYITNISCLFFIFNFTLLFLGKFKMASENDDYEKDYTVRVAVRYVIMFFVSKYLLTFIFHNKLILKLTTFTINVCMNKITLLQILMANKFKNHLN